VFKNAVSFVLLAIGPQLTSQRTQSVPDPLQAQPPAVVAAEKPRVFITDSESWEMSGSAAGGQRSLCRAISWRSTPANG